MNFNYIRMIEPLSDMAFTDIKNQLFHVFKEDKKYHPVMYLDDYRKVDLEEDLIRYEESYAKSNALAYKKDNTVGYYAGLTEDYFNYVLPCSDDSRAARYKQRAVKLLADVKNNKETDFSKVYDFFYIYVGLMREAEKNGFKKEDIKDLDMSLSMKDADLLKKLKDRKFEFPIVPNGNGRIEIQIPKIMAKKVDVPVTKREPGHEKEYLYIHSVLLLGNCLDQDGAYINKGDH